MTDRADSPFIQDNATQNVTDPYDSRRYRRYVLGVLTLTYTFSYLDRQVLVILQESIKQELTLSDTQLGLLSGIAFAMFYTTLGLFFARLADRGVRKRLLATILGIWSLMTATCGIAQNYAHLFLSRIGVGIGEAGCNPACHSMISDIYKPTERATAIAVYSSGINFGILLGFLGGGWFNTFIGWRYTFIVLGAVGLLLVPLIMLTLTEPRRGRSEAQVEVEKDLPPFFEVLGTMLRSPPFRQMLLACIAGSIASSALFAWMPSFLIRVHGLDSGTAGTWLALLIGVGGAFGTISGGWIADKLARRSRVWYAGIPAIGLTLAVPLSLATFFADNYLTTVAFFIFPAIIINVWLGPTFSLAHSLVTNRMRGLASSVIFFSMNLVGVSGGPLLVGMLSDVFVDRAGIDSLRYALSIVVCCTLMWSICHYLLAIRALKKSG